MTINQWQIQERGPGGQAPPPPPAILPKLRPKGPKDFFSQSTPPPHPPLSQGLDLALLLAD